MFKLLVLAVLATSFNLYAETNSEKFKAFNVDSPERQQFIGEQNRRVNNRIKTSPNLKKIEKAFRAFVTESTIAAIATEDKKTYKLIDRGLGLATDLVEVDAEGKTQTIFSSLTLSRNNIYNAINFRLTPSENRAVIVFSYKGSIDGYMLLTVDLETKKVLFRSSDKYFKSQPEYMFFKDDNSLIIETYDEDGKTANLVNQSIVSESSGEIIKKNAEIYSVDEDFLLAGNEDDQYFYVTKDSVINLGIFQDVEILAKQENNLILQSVVRTGDFFKTIYMSFDLTTQSSQKIFSVDFKATETTLMNKLILVQNIAGFKIKYYAYTPEGKLLSVLEAPFCCRITSMAQTIGSDGAVTGMKLGFTGIAGTAKYEWSFAEANAVVPSEILKTANENDKFAFVVEERFSKSADGTMVPYRLVYLKGLELKNKPVYMETYGGFNNRDLANNFSVYIRAFIMHGGVYAGPGVRGGNEYGDVWHEGAMKEKKMNTFADVASVAKDLIDHGITTGKQIAIAGSSNGGLTVAATGLLYPQYFGLIIPHNGVLDMLSKESLDKRFNLGWSHEYGDSRVEAMGEYMKKYSPVELMSQVVNPPRYLILNGRTDTRVNLAHSVKLAAVAQSAGHENVELISLNNSGHFNASMGMSDFIGWRLNVVKWSTIFDFFKMDY